MARVITDLVELAFVRHGALVRNYIASKIENADDAEDLAQDVFVRILKFRTMIREENLLSYVLCIAHNIIVDYQRRQQTRFKVEKNLMACYDSEPVTEFESQIHADEIHEQEMRIIGTMQDIRREIYVMSRLEDRSVKEIALELGLGDRQVERHLYEGRRLVRSSMRCCV